MKSNAQKIIAFAMISVACLNGARTHAAEDQDTVVMSGNDEEQRAAARRAKDAAWKPSSTEAGVIQVGDSKSPGAVKNFCLDADGNILSVSIRQKDNC
jgi:hypothetical protein